MDILMVSAELAPYTRATDTADFVASLSKALRQLGHRVTLALPRHPAFEEGGLLMARRLTPLSLGDSEVTVLDGQLASGVEITLFDGPGLFDRPSLFGEGDGYPDNLLRFALLSRGAAALAAKRAEQGKPFDVIHAFDAPAAATLALLRGLDLALPSVLTVLGTEPNGRFAGGARQAFPGLHAVGDDGVSLLELGLSCARVVVAGSEDLARDLASPALSGSLATSLTGEGRPVAVGCGLDYALFNPATDTAIAVRFDAEDASNKGRCKAAVLSELELELELDRPLVAAFAASVSEGQLLLKALPQLLKNDVAIVVSVPAAVAADIDRLAAEYPSDLARLAAGSAAASRRLMSGADFALSIDGKSSVATRVQSAQRYGAVPVALASGAAADAVVDCDAELETGTGFLFDAPTVDALVGAATRAFSAYGSPGHARLRRRVMRLDVSADRVARRYAQLYRKAAGT